MHYAITVLAAVFQRLHGAIGAFWRTYLDAAGVTVDAPMTWHKHMALWPVRTIEGKWATIVWRRRRLDGAWEYSVRQESFEDWSERN